MLPERPVVLLACDEPKRREADRRTLTASGFEVAEAADPSTTLAAVTRLQPDLLIMDLGGEASLATCTRIREAHSLAALPIMMRSTAGDTGLVERAFDSGATDFLTTPIDQRLFLARVGQLVQTGRLRQALHTSERQLADVELIARLGRWELDADDVFHWSHHASWLCGLSDAYAEMPRSDFITHVHPDDRERIEHTFSRSLQTGRGFEIDVRIILPKEGERVVSMRARHRHATRLETGILVGTIQDITDRHRSDARFNHLVHHDPLTGLPNRVLFRDRLENAVQRARRDHSIVGVFSLDINDFKGINDAFGHALADVLLQTFSQRLTNTVRGADTVARLGGNEFAVVQVGLSRPDGAERLVDRLTTALSDPFDLGGSALHIETNIGVTLYPDHGETPARLMRNADQALFGAKAKAPGAWRLFDETLGTAHRGRREIENDIVCGLEKGWFEIHYQPQFRTADRSLAGAEALLRLRHPDKGLVQPSTFIPVAEESGLIVPLGEWVLRTSCEQAARWNDMSARPIRVGVNVSAVQIAHSGLPALLGQVLERNRLDPALLELEITESTLMQDTAVALQALTRLRAQGIRLAMDDFGAGYSSLNYLRLFPFDRIKIDRSFVSGVPHNAEAVTIVTAMIKLGRNLGILTTVEGIETEEQARFLERQACDEMQGFYFSEPCLPSQLDALIGDQGHRINTLSPHPSTGLSLDHG